MRDFCVRYTGDYLDVDGQVTVNGGDIALDLYEQAPWIACDFLRDQQPQRNDDAYWANVYSMAVKPNHVHQANGIVIFRPWVKASAFAEGSDNLVVIGRAGAGCDKIDMAACTAADVAVFNAPDTLTHATASSAFVLMLALAKKLPQHQRMVREGRWDLQPQMMGDDLPGHTLGIVGLGKSGVELVRLVQPFGMRSIAYSPSADPLQAAAVGVTLVDSLEELFAQADFVSLHARLTDDKRGMIKRQHLRAMKPSAYFINVARGELVDERELVEVLQERKIAGAGLDVFEHEPLPVDHPLNALDNVILTPHWLPSTRQAARQTMEAMSRGMIAASQGEIPANVVNREVLVRPGFQEKLARYAVNRRDALAS
ncbi:MAG: dehydrogenase [Pirellulales bacterium]|nr:dehydrogenase [Pirellulales bacterium]